MWASEGKRAIVRLRPRWLDGRTRRAPGNLKETIVSLLHELFLEERNDTKWRLALPHEPGKALAVEAELPVATSVGEFRCPLLCGGGGGVFPTLFSRVLFIMYLVVDTTCMSLYAYTPPNTWTLWVNNFARPEGAPAVATLRAQEARRLPNLLI